MEAKTENEKLRKEIEQCRLALKVANNKVVEKVEELGALRKSQKEFWGRSYVKPKEVITAPVGGKEEVNKNWLWKIRINYDIPYICL